MKGHVDLTCDVMKLVKSVENTIKTRKYNIIVNIVKIIYFVSISILNSEEEDIFLVVQQLFSG